MQNSTIHSEIGRVGGWTASFTPFSTYFSHIRAMRANDERICNGFLKRSPPEAGLEPAKLGIARSTGQKQQECIPADKESNFRDAALIHNYPGQIWEISYGRTGNFQKMNRVLFTMRVLVKIQF